MAADRTILVPSSFGGRFDVVDVLVTLDVPLDAVRQGLVVQKTASRTTAEIAESMDYTVSVRNVGPPPSTGLTCSLGSTPAAGASGRVEWTFSGELGSAARGTVSFVVTLQ